MRFGHEGVVTYISTSQKGNRLNEVIVQRNIINHLPFSSKAHTSREIDSDLHRRGYRPAATKSFNSISTNQLGLTQAERPIMHGKPDNCRHLITWERYLTVDDGGLIRPNYFRSFYFLEIAYIFRKIFDRAA